MESPVPKAEAVIGQHCHCIPSLASDITAMQDFLAYCHVCKQPADDVLKLGFSTVSIVRRDEPCTRMVTMP